MSANFSSFSFDAAGYTPFVQSLYDEARDAFIADQNAVGIFSEAYEFIYAFMSVDANGNQILRVENGQLVDRSGNAIDIETWSRTDESDFSTWMQADGVDRNAWVFLQNVSSINANNQVIDGRDYTSNPVNIFVREYSKAQYIARAGEGNHIQDVDANGDPLPLSEAELDGQVQLASNLIASFIIQDGATSRWVK